MKAYKLQQFGFDGLVLTDQPEPQPGMKQVLVKVSAASLNYRDLLMANGFITGEVMHIDGGGRFV